MINNRPRVSIGVPVFNGEEFLAEALGSILAQTYTDFEVIISDNASTDRTPEICQAYAAKDERIRYYRNETNLGAAKNFNRVFELSSGEYFKWAAADNALEPEFLARCVEVLDNDPTVVLACTKLKRRDEFRNITLLKKDANHNVTAPKAYQRFLQLHGRGLGGNTPIWGLIRSSVLRETHLIRSFVGSDDCLLIELALKGKFKQVPEYLLLLRHHRGAYHYRMEEHDKIEGLEQAQWFDPANKRLIFILPHWRRLWERFLLVIRSEESLGGKCIMVGRILRKMIGWRKFLIKELFIAGRQVLRHLTVLRACSDELV